MKKNLHFSGNNLKNPHITLKKPPLPSNLSKCLTLLEKTLHHFTKASIPL
jgi:hypothetical protein